MYPVRATFFRKRTAVHRQCDGEEKRRGGEIAIDNPPPSASAHTPNPRDSSAEATQ